MSFTTEYVQIIYFDVHCTFCMVIYLLPSCDGPRIPLSLVLRPSGRVLTTLQEEHVRLVTTSNPFRESEQLRNVHGAHIFPTLDCASCLAS